MVDQFCFECPRMRLYYILPPTHFLLHQCMSWDRKQIHEPFTKCKEVKQVNHSLVSGRNLLWTARRGRHIYNNTYHKVVVCLYVSCTTKLQDQIWAGTVLSSMRFCKLCKTTKAFLTSLFLPLSASNIMLYDENEGISKQNKQHIPWHPKTASISLW